MKQLQETLEHLSTLQDNSFHTNKAGFPAYKNEGIDRLREILFLGITGNTYYVSARQNIQEKLSDLSSLIQEIDPDTVSDIIVEARNEGFFRHLPIIALILLRKRSPVHFQKIFNRVILTGQDLSDFLTLCRSMNIGFGRSVKKTIHRWLEEKVNAFYAVKYRRCIADAIAISRPKVDSFKNKSLLSYCYALKSSRVKRSLEIDDLQLFACERFKKLVRDGNIDRAIDIAEQVKLPADVMISIIGSTNDEKIWRVIAKNMGVMQFLKYLNKLSSVLSTDVLLDLCKEKLQIDYLLKAKVFPYSIFLAWFFSKSGDIRQYLQNLLETYPARFDFGSWKKYNIVIAPDISLSMTSKIRGGLSPSAIAGYFSSVMAKGIGLDEIYAWHSECEIINIKDKSVTEIFTLVYKADGNATDITSPIRTLLLMQKKVDIILFITDQQHWYSPFTTLINFKNMWKEYKNKINPHARVVIIEVVGYGDKVVDEKFAKDYDVFFVYGWNDTVFKFIEMKVLNVC